MQLLYSFKHLQALQKYYILPNIHFLPLYLVADISIKESGLSVNACRRIFRFSFFFPQQPG